MVNLSLSLSLSLLLSQYLPKEYVNLLLNIIFFSVGVTALTRAGRYISFII